MVWTTLTSIRNGFNGYVGGVAGGDTGGSIAITDTGGLETFAATTLPLAATALPLLLFKAFR